MNKLMVATALGGLVLTLAACGEKKQSEDIIAQPVVKAQPKAPEHMQEYTDDREVQWIGKTYHVKVHRQPADSLPMVKDETGQKFVDNVFTLTVSRADGSVFFRREFTKSSVSQYITESYRKTGILEGLVFDKPDGDWLEFAASVGRPETDEYIPLIVRLSRMGNLEIRQDTQMDISANAEDDDI